MSFSESYLIDRNIKKVLHVGADRGGELGQYETIGVEEVVWVEANPEVYGELLTNLGNWNSHVVSHPYNVLISDHNGFQDFHLYYGWDAGPMVGNKGMSSLLKASPNHWSAQCHRGTLNLQCYTLDSFLEQEGLDSQYDLLNMDVQGAELMVCYGAPKTLANVRYINTEVTMYEPQYQDNPLFPELQGFLEGLGFEYVAVNMSAPNWGDAIFKKVGEP
jgi:FkbM family methyltransferase